MRVKIAVDIEISPRIKRLLLWAIPVSILAAGGIAWASLPHTFASGETLTAANLNGDLQSLDSRVGALEGVRVVYGAVTSNTLNNQSPAGWGTVAITTSSASESCGAYSGDFKLTFAVPFSAPPYCTLPPIDYFGDGATTSLITASSIVVPCASGQSGPPFTIVCIGPP